MARTQQEACRTERGSFPATPASSGTPVNFGGKYKYFSHNELFCKHLFELFRGPLRLVTSAHCYAHICVKALEVEDPQLQPPSPSPTLPRCRPLAEVPCELAVMADRRQRIRTNTATSPLSSSAATSHLLKPPPLCLSNLLSFELFRLAPTQDHRCLPRWASCSFPRQVVSAGQPEGPSSDTRQTHHLWVLKA